MLSNFYLGAAFGLLVVGALMWLVFGFEDQDRQVQLVKAIAALERLTHYWIEKRGTDGIGAYAETKLTSIAVDKTFLTAMQARLKAGHKLAIGELVRVDDLISDYLRDDPALFAVSCTSREVVG